MASRSAIDDFPRLVLDANIMAGALAGSSFPVLLRLFQAGVMLFAPLQQMAETRHVLLAKMSLPVEWVDAQMKALDAILVVLHPASLEAYRERSLRRLGPRGQSDWPVLAATYAVDGAAWSRDKDLFGTGAPVWSTRVLAREAALLPLD